MTSGQHIAGPQTRTSSPKGEVRSPGRLLVLGLAVAVVLLLAGWWLCEGQSRLELRLEPRDRLLADFPLESGEDFTLWFLHSYDRAFFQEHYRLGDSGIVLTHMSFKSNLNGEGFEYSDFHLRPDGVGELRNINEPRDRVRFMMGSPDLANHTLIIHDRRMPLLQWAQTGQLVYLQAARTPRWRVWLRRLTGL